MIIVLRLIRTLCVPFKQREFTTHRELVSKFSAVSPFLTKGINSSVHDGDFRNFSCFSLPNEGNQQRKRVWYISPRRCFYHPDDGNQQQKNLSYETNSRCFYHPDDGNQQQRRIGLRVTNRCFYHPDDGNQQLDIRNYFRISSLH